MKTEPLQLTGQGTRRLSPVNLAFLLSVVSVALLLLPEIWLSLAAFVWAMSGLLHLAKAYSLALWLLCLPVGLWASWQVLVLAFASATSGKDESATG